MRRLSWIVTLPLLVVAVVFAVVNRQAVPVHLWPLQSEVELPLYFLVLAALAIGLIGGMLVGWLSAGGARRRAREARAKARALSQELERVRRDQAIPRPPPAEPEPARRPLRLIGGDR